MRLRDLGKHLVDYLIPGLEEISIEGREYLTNSEEPDMFVGCAFGVGEEYNKILARTIQDGRKYFGKNIAAYVQSEIGCQLKEMGGKNFTSSLDKGRVFTLDILKGAKDIGEKEEYVFSSHPGQIFRLTEIAEKLGMGGEIFIPKEVSWPSDDLQTWVRGPEVWSRKEPLVRLQHWMFGWVPREF